MLNQPVEQRARFLAARVDHFTTLLLFAYAQYLFLRPMARNVELIARYGGSRKGTGFQQLRNTLYWALIQELAKLCADKDSRTVSIPSIGYWLLRDPELRKYLLKLHSRPGFPRKKGERYRDWQALQREERAEQRVRLRATYKSLRTNLSALKCSRELKAIKTVRDKMLSHHEAKDVKGELRLFDLAKLRLKFGDERRILEQAREIAVALNSLIRGTSFSWDSYVTVEEQDVCAFWEIPSIDGTTAQ